VSVTQPEAEPGTSGRAPARRPDPAWRDRLTPYARPRLGRSLADLATSVVPYLGISVLMYLVVDRWPLLALALALPAAGFLLRTFMVFHDCAHGSFLPSRRANAWLGVVVGVLVFECFQNWRHSHAVHHATAGDLDRRGVGDVTTLTVAEYLQSTPLSRLGYRLFRNPLVMFGLGPIFALILQPRRISRGQRPRLRRSVLRTDVAIVVLIAALCWLVGWRAFLLVEMIPVMIAGSAGIWLFYVQHQFEETYWESGEEWSYADAALRGSSYLKLPKVLQFFTSSIGLHHVHHLNARIPNYNLQGAHDENEIFHGVPTLSMRDGFRAVRLKLWDEDRGQLVTFAEARRG
jgi:omega-6 fatty acid desaturase (delta-12 desaturase)